MPKIKVYLDTGANIHSCKERIIDTYEEWGISDEEWDEMECYDREALVKEWVDEQLHWDWYEEGEY